MEKGKAQLNTRVHEDWMKWLRGGPAGGVGRQHRFVRTPQGWIPGSVGRPRRLVDKERRDADARDDRELRLLLGGLGDEEAPLGRQAEVEDQANVWGRHWGGEGKEARQVE